MLTHHIDQGKSASDIILVVLPRLLHTLAHGLETREMDAGIEFMSGKNFLQPFAVTDVDLVKWYLGNTDDFGHALERHGVAVA